MQPGKHSTVSTERPVVTAPFVRGLGKARRATAGWCGEPAPSSIHALDDPRVGRSAPWKIRTARDTDVILELWPLNPWDLS
jgi:hypothetical protein